MRKLTTIALLLIATLPLFGGCSKGKNSNNTPFANEQDSVAYILGMNIGRNLWQMDSTLNVEALAAGIRDHYARAERFTLAEAERIYLHYINVSKPEAVLAYEDRFLEEIVRDNRSYARSKSGLTYAVEEVGEVDLTPKAAYDTVSFRYLGRTIDGREFDSSYTRGDTTRMALGDLLEGLQESLKLIGKGGRIMAYLPAALGYGAEGNQELEVAPNSTLYYEIELIGVEPAGKNIRTGRRATKIEF